MIILNSRKLIYIHIHKTGGEAIEHCLEKLREWNDVVLDSAHPRFTQEYERLFGLRKHSSALEVVNVIGMPVWKSYLTWTTVRNPYERMASLYGYLASLSEPKLSQIGFPQDGSADVQRRWVESSSYPRKHQWAYPGVRAYLATRGSRTAFSDFLRHPLNRDHEPAFRTQFSKLCNPHADGLLVDRVVKLETLSSLWPTLCSEMGIPPTELPVRNATPDQWKHSVDDLFCNPDDVEFVNNNFSDDFRWFDYEPVQSIRRKAG